MRLTLAVFLMLSLVSTVMSADDCPSCELLGNASDANILIEMDRDAHILQPRAFYEDLNASPSRQPIDDYVLIVHMTNTTGLNQLVKIYTDSNGSARLDFTEWSGGCINFKVLYCPFCDPAVHPICGFGECMNYSSIDPSEADNIVGTVSSVDDVPVALAPSQSVPGTLNPNLYFPALKQAAYCPPPPERQATPALCLPLLLIFAVLSGSLYLTGRNPFVGFNIGGMRVGKHIRYQARGRGFSFSGMAALSLVATAARVGKTLAKSEKEGGGWKGVAKMEKQAAQGRSIVGMVKRVGKAGKRGGKILSQISKGLSREQEGDSGFLGIKGMFRRGDRINREIEATAPGASGAGDQMVKGGGGEMIHMPGSSSYSPRFGELFGREGLYGVGFLTYVATSTTVGGYFDQIITRTITDKGLFENCFIDADHRTQVDRETLLEMRNEVTSIRDGRVGMIVEVSGGRVVIEGVREGANGSRVFTVRAEEGSERGQTADGRMEVTLDRDGKVSSISYQREVPGLVEGQETTRAQITITRDESGQTQVQVQLPPTEEHPDGETRTLTEPPANASQEQLNLWDNLTSPAMMGLPTNLSVGMDASSFVDNYTDTVSDLNTIQTSINQHMQSEQEARRRAGEEIARSPEGQEVLRRAQEDEAGTVLAETLGTSPVEPLRPGEKRPGEKRPGELPPGRTELQTVVGGRTFKEATGLLRDAAEASGMRQQMDQDHHIEEFTSATGPNMSRADAQAAAGALTGYISSQPRDELASASAADMRRGVTDTLVSSLQQRGVPEESARQQAEAIVARIPVGTFREVSSSAQDFYRQLSRSGAPPELVSRVGDAQFGQVMSVVAVADRHDSETGWAMDTLASRHADISSLPPEAQERVRVYRHHRSMVEEGRRMTIDPFNVDFTMQAAVSERFGDANYDYLQQSAAIAAYNQGGLREKTEAPGGTHYERLNTALDAGYRREVIDQHLPAHVTDPTLDQAGREVMFARHEHSSTESFNTHLNQGNYREALSVASRQYEMYRSLAASGDPTMQDFAQRWGDAMGVVGRVRARGERMGEAEYGQLLSGLPGRGLDDQTVVPGIGLRVSALSAGRAAVAVRANLGAERHGGVADVHDELYIRGDLGDKAAAKDYGRVSRETPEAAVRRRKRERKREEQEE